VQRQLDRPGGFGGLGHWLRLCHQGKYRSRLKNVPFFKQFFFFESAENLSCLSPGTLTARSNNEDQFRFERVSTMLF